jgi:tetratricopeptide (TPR) repeat protein
VTIGEYISMRGIVLAVTLVAATSARADDVADAKAHWEEGTKLYDLGRYKEAAREYEESFRLKPKAEMLFNIGQAYRQGGDYEAALRAYRGFLRRFPESENRQDVEGYIRTCQAHVDEEKRKAAEPPPAPVEPTPAPTPAPAPAPVVVPPPVAPVVVAPAPREHVPAYKRWWLWTIVGVVVVGGGAAALAVVLTTPKNAPSPPGTMTLVFP